MQKAQVTILKIQTTIEPVTDLDISKVINLRESKSFLKKRLEQIEADLDSVECDLISRIEDGAVIQSRFPVSIKTTERRYPSWKDAFVAAVGESEAKKVTESTRPTISKSIVISSK